MATANATSIGPGLRAQLRRLPAGAARHLAVHGGSAARESRVDFSQAGGNLADRLLPAGRQSDRSCRRSAAPGLVAGDPGYLIAEGGNLSSGAVRSMFWLLFFPRDIVGWRARRAWERQTRHGSLAGVAGAWYRRRRRLGPMVASASHGQAAFFNEYNGQTDFSFACEWDGGSDMSRRTCRDRRARSRRFAYRTARSPRTRAGRSPARLPLSAVPTGCPPFQ